METTKTAFSSGPRTEPKSIAAGLTDYLDWFRKILETRTETYFQPKEDAIETSLFEIHPPPILPAFLIDQSCKEHGLGDAGKLILTLATVPLIQPQLLDIFFVKNTIMDRGYTEFGGILGKTFGGFIPTAETAMFLLAGSDLHLRLQYRSLFQPSNPLFAEEILQSWDVELAEPELSFPIAVTEEYRHLLLSGAASPPTFSRSFPAKRLSTNLEWDDLVLDETMEENLEEMRSWLENGKQMLQSWNLGKHLKPGYRSLFYGPPGTGKTMAATLLGKLTGKPVYRIDLSLIVSKWIGETEKNLGEVFDKAQEKDWILFFDEADALFGKRSQTSSSNDRHANQQVSYLLQRIEDFPGIVILASNFKTNLDPAFMRRFQSVIGFTLPDAARRKQLWVKAFPTETPLDPGIDFELLAKHYSVSGGEIINIVRHAALRAYSRPESRVALEDILFGIRKVFQRDGKIFEAFLE